MKGLSLCIHLPTGLCTTHLVNTCSQALNFHSSLESVSKLSAKGKTVNTFCAVARIAYIATLQLYFCGAKAAINNI